MKNYYLTPFYYVLVAILGCCFAVLSYLWHDVRVVVSPSVPVGLYRLTPIRLEQWQYVVYCASPEVAAFGHERHYIPRGNCPDGSQPFVKQVGALPGDVVDILPESVRVNSVLYPQSATQDVDSAGRLLPHVPYGQYTVDPGQVWVFSFHHDHSWDSRYYGPIPQGSIYSGAVPLLTWGH